MFLVVKMVRNVSSGGTTQNITAVATEDALEEYILRHGLDNCEVYKAEKLKFNLSWQPKNRKEHEIVFSSKED